MDKTLEQIKSGGKNLRKPVRDVAFDILRKFIDAPAPSAHLGANTWAWRHLRIALFVVNPHLCRTMGDKSPKSKDKRAGQNQTKVNEDNRKKQAAAVAKQVPQKKK